MKKGTLFLALWLAVSSFARLNLQDKNKKKNSASNQQANPKVDNSAIHGAARTG